MPSKWGCLTCKCAPSTQLVDTDLFERVVYLAILSYVVVLGVGGLVQAPGAVRVLMVWCWTSMG